MSDEVGENEAAPANAAAGAGRVSFERLRERTDELELIISGLSLLALLSIPGALWDVYEGYAGRLSLGLAAASVVALPLISAICHVMVVLLVLHLAVRAHWVGLIGLKAVFPEGVRWERLSGLGPLTLAQLQARVRGIEQGIARADRIASTLFSLITYAALALAILGGWMALLFGLVSAFGEQLGGVNTFLNAAIPWLFIAYFGAPLARWLLDGVLLRRLPRLQRVAPLRWLVRALGLVEGLFLPQRLLGVTRLTLQSHLLPRSFLCLFILAVLLTMWFSGQMMSLNRTFDLLGTQQYISGQATAGGLRSSYYESQRIPQDRLWPQPMIPAPVIETAWLPVFLPYVALIDDPVLAQRCPSPSAAATSPPGFNSSDRDEDAIKRESATDQITAQAAACLRRVWEVRLDGEVQSLEGFLPSERADLGLRGLSGWIPLNPGAAGPRRLEVIWRPRPEQDALVEDYVPQRHRHVIPFLWSPESAAQPGALP
jgi:hypothetical protein